MKFGLALAEGRRAAGIPTQAALARITGISPASICQYERGSLMPDFLTVARITSAAGIDPVPLIAAITAEDDQEGQP